MRAHRQPPERHPYGRLESNQPAAQTQDDLAAEKGIRADTLRRLLAKVDEISESQRAIGLPDDLLAILRDDLEENQFAKVEHA